MTRREQGRVNAQRWRDAHPGSAAAASKLYRDGKTIGVKPAKAKPTNEIVTYRPFNYERKYK